MAKPLDPARNHVIPLAQAAADAKRHRGGGPHRIGDSGAFNAAAVLGLLQQPGCVGLRYYRGRTATAEDSMILVGVDAAGNDMTGGIVLDSHFPCPPFCPDGNTLNT